MLKNGCGTMKIYNYLILLALLVTICPLHAFDRFQGQLSPTERPSRVIVRFVEGQGFALLDSIFDSGGQINILTANNSLADLRQRHNISKIQRVFPASGELPIQINSSSAISVITQSQAVTLEQQEYARFQQHARQIQARFPQRTARAHPQANIPNLTGVFSMEFSSRAGAEQICAELNQMDCVIYAVPAEQAELHYVPDDYYYAATGSWGQTYDDLYALKSDKLNCQAMWDLALGDGTIVAVIDTGVDLSHEDLTANLWLNTAEIPDNGLDDDNNGYTDDIYGYDFSDQDADPSDYIGHGTHCAGIIGAVGNNTIGIIGVCPNTRVMALKAFPNAYDDVLAQAIRYAADNGADVLSNSWGPSSRKESNPIVEDAIDYACALGCVVVFSAGNEDDDVRYYSPANYHKTITVAATDHTDTKASFSNYGSAVDISAPGMDILSLRADGTDMYQGSTGYTSGERFVPAFNPAARYYRANGTSMACPYVAGLAAQIISYFPTYTNEMVTGRIIGSADNIDASNSQYIDLLGSGRVNGYTALTATPTPYIKFIEYVIDDALSTGSHNGSLEPNESVDLIVSLRNCWADVDNVTAILSCSDPLVTISQNTAGYGSLTCGQISDNTTNPFQFTLSDQAEAGHEIIFTLAINGDNYSRTQEFSCPVNFGNLAGWPLESDARDCSNSPIVTDIDGDGKGELLIGFDNALYIYNDDGTSYPNFPQSVTGNYYILYNFVVGDIDGDGDPEVLGAADPVAGPVYGFIYAWHIETGQLVDGWPKSLGKNGYSTISLANFDDNEDDLEIVVVALHRNDPYGVWILQGDGSDLPGWPIQLPFDSANRRGVAIGNIDNLPGNEIIISTGISAIPAYVASPIFVYRADGTPMPGWPKDTNGYLCDPVLANLDDTDDLEIIVGAVTENHNGNLYAWKSDGSNVPGWPRPYNTFDVSVGDLNGDGVVEIISACRGYGKLRLFENSGNLLWEKSVSVSSTASIVDINDDGVNDIVFNSFSKLNAYGFDGNVIAGFPMDLGATAYAQPAICDFDGNGDIEIVTRTNYSPRKLYAFDLKTPLPKRQEWPMFRRDIRQSNRHPLYYEGDLNGDWTVNLLDIGWLADYWTESNCNNIFGGEGDWCYGADIDKSGEVNLFDFQRISQDWLCGD